MNLFQEAQPSFVSVKGDVFCIDGISRNALQVLIQQIQPIRKFFQDGKLICYSMDAKTSRTRKKYCAFCSSRHKCSPKLRISMIWLHGLDPIVLDLNRPSFTNLEEFVNADGALPVEVGAQVDVYLQSQENEHGQVELSKEKADKLKIWEELNEAVERDELVGGTITGRVKGGLTVDSGVKAFLPGSQVDLRPVRNLMFFI